MCPRVPTQESQSSSLVLEMKGCEAQSGCEMGPRSSVTVNVGLCCCGSVVSALGAGGKSRGTGPTLAALASESEPSIHKGDLASQREGFT